MNNIDKDLKEIRKSITKKFNNITLLELNRNIGLKFIEVLKYIVPFTLFLIFSLTILNNVLLLIILDVDTAIITTLLAEVAKITYDYSMKQKVVDNLNDIFNLNIKYEKILNNKCELEKIEENLKSIKKQKKILLEYKMKLDETAKIDYITRVSNDEVTNDEINDIDNEKTLKY